MVVVALVFFSRAMAYAECMLCNLHCVVVVVVVFLLGMHVVHIVTCTVVEVVVVFFQINGAFTECMHSPHCNLHYVVVVVVLFV